MLVSRKVLTDALRIVNRVVSRNCRIPVLRNVRIDSNGSLTLTATDLDKSVVMRLPGSQHDAAFTALVNAATLTNLVKSGKSPEVALSPVEGGVQVDAARMTTGEDLADFPDPKPSEDEVALVRVPAKALAEAIRLTVPFASEDATRYALTGVYFEALKGKGFSLVASDGRQLGWQRVEGAEVLKTGSVIVPPETARTILYLAQAAPETVAVVSFNEKGNPPFIRVRVGDNEAYGRCIEGTFPADFRHVIPLYSKQAGNWSVDRAELETALAQVVGVLPKNKTRCVRFSFTNDKVEMYAKNNFDLSEARAEIAVKGKGDDTVLSLDSSFIESMLKALPKACGRVTLQTEGNTTATIWHVEGNKGYTYLLMPLKDA